jgi:flagellar protein FliS
MYGNQGVQRYRDTALGTMTREKMVVLLYEKAISDLEDAIAAIEVDDRLRFTQRINHSQRIVAELRGALDHSIGGEISRNLEALYDFLFQQHLRLLVERDPQLVRSCIQVLRPLLDAWRQVPNGTAETAARERMHGSPTGADPAAPRPGGDGGLAAAPRANAPEVTGVRPSLLSVSA